MYEKLPQSEEDTLGYEIREVLTEEQLTEMLDEIEEAIAEHGSVRLLVYVPSVPYPDIKALDDDLGFWLRHREHIDRYAVVGDSPLLEWASRLTDRVSHPDVEHFGEDDLPEAWAWVRAPSDVHG